MNLLPLPQNPRELEAGRLPELELTRGEFDGLGEYSCSLPTGVRIGKRWKRNLNAYVSEYAHLDFFDGAPAVIVQPEVWVVGEYCAGTRPGYADVRWYRPVVRSVISRR